VFGERVFHIYVFYCFCGFIFFNFYLVLLF